MTKLRTLTFDSFSKDLDPKLDVLLSASQWLTLVLKCATKKSKYDGFLESDIETVHIESPAAEQGSEVQF